MLPAFLVRRLRWAWAAALASTLWMNRRDLSRWVRFLRRSVARRSELDLQAWLTEARVRTALTMDPVLRTDPEVDDVAVDGGKVTLRTSSTGWPDSTPHLDRIRSVKGVTSVQYEPGVLVGGVRLATDGTPVV